MKLAKQKTNYAPLKIAIVFVILLIAAYIGYAAYTYYKSSSEQTISTSVEDVQSAPTIKATNDLEEAATTIDDAEIEETNLDDMTEIDKELSAF